METIGDRRTQDIPIGIQIHQNLGKASILENVHIAKSQGLTHFLSGITSVLISFILHRVPVLGRICV
jgi:hypothetical protein